MDEYINNNCCICKLIPIVFNDYYKIKIRFAHVSVLREIPIYLIVR